MKINEAAKQLPEGKYETDPSTDVYQEAQELNSTLTQAAADIQKADQAKRDLIANVSHDLRTPLTMITGYGEMMQDLPEEKTDENLQVIVDESKRLNALVNDLLDLSKLQEGKITINPEEIDLSDLIRTQMRKYDVYRMQEGFEIEESIEDGLTASADRKRLEQVFNNFMTNAINYSGEKKHIVVKVYAEGNNAKVEVRDFGAGIEKKDLPNIWDRYQKSSHSFSRSMTSTGLGLAIVRGIAEAHGAGYGVSSEKGKGSMFWLELRKTHEA
jgi:signal transduction histidine kinase